MAPFSTQTQDAGEVPLQAKLAFLRQPESYPDSAVRVEAVETHMSWVFLTDSCAWKLKKPVFYADFDARTLARRRFYCEEELRLNRRLAAWVYLDVVPVTIDSSGMLHLGGDGPAVDWLVKMRRLPMDRMLDYALKAGAASPGDMDTIARVLAQFHSGCTRPALSPGSLRDRLAEELARCRERLARPEYALPRQQIERVAASQDAALGRHAGQLEERVRQGHVIEGHGDLRAEHVFIGEPLAIIDCIEFSRDLRVADSADETAFLALECERLGAPSLASLLLACYVRYGGDLPEPSLIHLYQSVRASTRARLAIQHLDEEQFRYSPEWRRRALDWLELAQVHAQAA